MFVCPLTAIGHLASAAGSSRCAVCSAIRLQFSAAYFSKFHGPVCQIPWFTAANLPNSTTSCLLSSGFLTYLNFENVCHFVYKMCSNNRLGYTSSVVSIFLCCSGVLLIANSDLNSKISVIPYSAKFCRNWQIWWLASKCCSRQKTVVPTCQHVVCTGEGLLCYSVIINCSWCLLYTCSWLSVSIVCPFRTYHQ